MPRPYENEEIKVYPYSVEYWEVSSGGIRIVKVLLDTEDPKILAFSRPRYGPVEDCPRTLFYSEIVDYIKDAQRRIL